MRTAALLIISIFLLTGLVFPQNDIKTIETISNLSNINISEKIVDNNSDDENIPERQLTDFNIINKEFFEFSLGLIFDLVIILIIGTIYYKARKKKNILFALLLLNIVVFIVCFLLQSVEISIGFAFGIFAIFSILRYRTSTVPIKEMTYIFISISIAIINALTIFKTGSAIMLSSNIIILLALILFEMIFNDSYDTNIIVYEDLTMITPDHYEELLSDIKKRTGLNISSISIGRIDYKNGQVLLKIYYN